MREKTPRPAKWEQIKLTAIALGATPEMLRQWAFRGAISDTWKVKIIQHGTAIGLTDMEFPPR